MIIKGVPNVKIDSKDVPPTQHNPFDVDSNALSILRSTTEVLPVVSRAEVILAVFSQRIERHHQVGPEEGTYDEGTL